MFCTVIGIPWARSCFVIGTFALLPFGREVISRETLKGQKDLGTGCLGLIGNIVWFVLAGFWLALAHALCGISLTLTIIGIPFAIQHFKLASLAIAPVGKTIVPKHIAHAARSAEAEEYVRQFRGESGMNHVGQDDHKNYDVLPVAMITTTKESNCSAEPEQNEAIAKLKKLEQLKGQISQAKKLLDERLLAWRQAGSPNFGHQHVDSAKQEVGRLWAVVSDANKQRRMAGASLACLKFAHSARKTASKLDMPGFVIALIGGTVIFALAILVALIVTKIMGLIFSIGGIGFLCGFFPSLLLLYFPKDVTKRIANLSQRRADRLRRLKAGKLAYQKAQHRFEQLERLHQLRSDCKKALLEKQRLQLEFQESCDK